MVANEVKDLARMTASASNDISGKISIIRVDSESSVKAIQEIGRIINEIDHIQTSVTSAVQEQAATTSEMSRNVHEAAWAVRDCHQYFKRFEYSSKLYRDCLQYLLDDPRTFTSCFRGS